MAEAFPLRAFNLNEFDCFVFPSFEIEFPRSYQFSLACFVEGELTKEQLFSPIKELDKNKNDKW